MAVKDLTFPYFAKDLKLSAPQARFIRSAAMKKQLNCGRFGGKTFLALIDVLWWALWLFAYRKADKGWWRAGPVVTVGLFAPTETNFLPMWNLLLDLIPKIPGKAADGTPNTHIMRDAQRVTLFGFLGIQIDMISCWSTDNIRGAGYDIILVDEAALLKSPMLYYRQISQLVIRAGYFGKVVMASTPRNNFWDRWVQSARDGKGRFADFEAHHWTPFDNPRLTAAERDEILRTREETPDVYRQEYLAELFVEPLSEQVREGAKVWTPGEITAALATEEQTCTGPFAAGLDLAWAGTDQACLVVIDKARNLVCHVEFWDKTTNKELLAIVERTHAQWVAPTFYFDRTGSRARAFAEILPPRYQLHPLVFRRSIDRNRHAEYIVSKDLLVRSVTQRFSVGMLRIPDPDQYPLEKLPWCNEQDQQQNLRTLIRQLNAFTRITVRNSSGDEEFIYKPGEYRDESGRMIRHDDFVDGLLLASRGLETITEPHISLEDLERGLMVNW